MQHEINMMTQLVKVYRLKIYTCRIILQHFQYTCLYCQLQYFFLINNCLSLVVQKRKQCRCVEFRVGLKTGHKFHCTQQNFIILVRRQSIGMQCIRSLCLRIILMCELNNDYVIMLSLFLNVNRIGVLRLQLPVWSCITGGRFNPHMPE